MGWLILALAACAGGFVVGLMAGLWRGRRWEPWDACALSEGREPLGRPEAAGGRRN